MKNDFEKDFTMKKDDFLKLGLDDEIAKSVKSHRLKNLKSIYPKVGLTKLIVLRRNLNLM